MRSDPYHTKLELENQIKAEKPHPLSLLAKSSPFLHIFFDLFLKKLKIISFCNLGMLIYFCY